MTDNVDNGGLPSGAPSPTPAEPAAPETPGRKLSASVFAFEQAIVVTVLLMMVVTYVLTVLWNNAHLQVDQFDQMVLRFAGYETPESTPPETLATITGVVSPVILGVVLFLLSLLAVRSRERARIAEGEAPPPVNWPKRLLWAAIITGGLWGGVALVSSLPASAMVFTALAIILGAGGYMQLRHGLGSPRARGLASLAAGALAGWGVSLALDPATTSWFALASTIVASLVLYQQGHSAERRLAVFETLVGGIAGLGLVSGFSAFLEGQIPGYIAACMAIIFAVGYLGPQLAGMLGAVVGGGLLAWYYITKAGTQYDWTSGLTAILLLYVGFLGASMATHDGHHISVDMVRKNLKSRYFHLYNAIGEAVALGFTAFLAVMGTRYLIHMLTGGDFHAASNLPTYIAVVPIGFAFTMMVVRFGIRIAASWNAFRRGEPAPELKPELH